LATNYGWLRLNNLDTFKLAFEDSKTNVDYENTITQLPLDTVIGFSFGVTKRFIKVINVRTKTQADAESILSQLQALQETGTPFSLQWQVNSGGAAGDFFAFDGTIRSMNVLCKNVKGISKAPGDSTIFFIDGVTFVEASKS